MANPKSHKQKQDRENDTHVVGRRTANGLKDESRNPKGAALKKIKKANEPKD